MGDFLVLLGVISGLNESLLESIEQFSSDGGFDLSEGVLVCVFLLSDFLADTFGGSLIGVLGFLGFVELGLLLFDVGLESVELLDVVVDSEVFLDLIPGGEQVAHVIGFDEDT